MNEITVLIAMKYIFVLYFFYNKYTFFQQSNNAFLMFYFQNS